MSGLRPSATHRQFSIAASCNTSSSGVGIPPTERNTYAKGSYAVSIHDLGESEKVMINALHS